MLFFNENVKEAVDAPRMHHQLMPMEIDYQFGNTKVGDLCYTYSILVIVT